MTATATVTPPAAGLARKSDAWTDLALTLPLFLAYHLAVVFLPVRNAADPVTTELSLLAEHSLVTYATLTLAIGAAFVAVLLLFGQRKALSPRRFLFIALEGALYAVVMRAVAAAAVGSLPLGPDGPASSPFSSVVMAIGAGFYEEIAFRVGLFGVGRFVLRKVLGSTGPTAVLALVAWAIAEAAVFSGWHYVGALGDHFDLRSFVFRATCGLLLTAVYALRGFAPAVWTHALYDVWVMV